MNYTIMNKNELLIGLKGLLLGFPGPWYTAALSGWHQLSKQEKLQFQKYEKLNDITKEPFPIKLIRG